MDDAAEQRRRDEMLDLTDRAYAAWRAASPDDIDRVLKAQEGRHPVTTFIKALFGLLSPANYKKAFVILSIAYGVLSAARDAVGAVLAALQ